MVLDLDSGSFEPRVLKTPGFSGTAGDELINVAGFTGTDNADGRIDILITNMRPSVDENGKLVDQYAHGGNTTIERFTTGAGMSEMKHVKTYADRGIATPNRVATMEDGTVYVTNDHGPHKTGWVSHDIALHERIANSPASPPFPNPRLRQHKRLSSQRTMQRSIQQPTLPQRSSHPRQHTLPTRQYNRRSNNLQYPSISRSQQNRRDKPRLRA